MLSTRVENCTQQPDNLCNPEFTAEESKETVCLPKQKSYNMRPNKTLKNKLVIFSLLESSVTSRHLYPASYTTTPLP